MPGWKSGRPISASIRAGPESFEPQRTLRAQGKIKFMHYLAYLCVLCGEWILNG